MSEIPQLIIKSRTFNDFKKYFKLIISYYLAVSGLKSVDIPSILRESQFEFNKKDMLESPFIVICTLCDEELEVKFDINGLFDINKIEEHNESHIEEIVDNEDDNDDCSNNEVEHEYITFKS